MHKLQQSIRLWQQGQHELALAQIGELPETGERNQAWIHMLIQRRQPPDLEQAIQLAARWMEFEPANPEPARRLTEIALNQGNLDQAETAAAELQKRAPGHPLGLMMAAVLEQLCGRIDAAFDRALQAEQGLRRVMPSDAKGSAAARVGAAMRIYETACGNYPGSPARDDLAPLDQTQVVERLKQELEHWAGIAGKADVQDQSDFSNAWYSLGCLFMADFDRHAECLECFSKALQLDPGNEAARINQVYALNYGEREQPEKEFQAHVELGSDLQSRTPQLPRPSRAAGKRIRLAYLSSDFRRHSVAHYILPVLERHDRDRFEIHSIYTHQKSDEVTRRVRQASEHWQQLPQASPAELARTIQSAGIDILVDLNGLTSGHQLQTLCMKPAPVQASWIGYPNTTGLSTVDYRLVDVVTDPGDDFSIEMLLRLPDIFSVYAWLGELPRLASPPCLEQDGVTFGSFNNLSKINKSLVGTWSKILHACPDSKLLIKNIGLTYKEPAARLRRRFADHGIPAERLQLMGKVDSQNEHMQVFNQVDVCLDSFPYNGTTTNCDSLLMGVPVVTRAGQSHRARVGASQLTAIGLEECIARDEQHYVDIALDLANAPDRLVEWRLQLRERLINSPLMDAESFTRELEAVYERISKSGQE